jgi:hypothetical protein
MTKETRSQAQKRLSLQLHHHQRALQRLVLGQVDATARARIERARYVLRLVDAQGAMGGLIVETCHHASTGAEVTVRVLDTYLSELAPRVPYSIRLAPLLTAYRELARERDRIVGRAA